MSTETDSPKFGEAVADHRAEIDIGHDDSAPDFKTTLNSTTSAEQWPLLRDWLEKYPSELGHYLRDHQPVLQTPDCVLLSRFEHVVEALEQPEIFSVELYKPKMGSYLMTEDNTDRHNLDKALMRELLKQEDMANVRQVVREAAMNIVTNHASMNLINDYSRQVPALLVQRVFGIDGVSTKKLIGWSYWNQVSAFHNQEFLPLGNSKHVESKKFRSNIMMGIYIGFLLLRKYWNIRRGTPHDDTVTRLLQRTFPTHGSLQILRKGINTGGLLIGAVETTSEAVAHICEQLAKRPDAFAQAQRLALLSDTREFDLLCWEALRQRPIAPYIFRKLTKDYTLKLGDSSTTTLKAGQTVLCVIATAMFDPQATPEPDKFDRNRPFGHSFHLGHGHHECLGRDFGMVMIPEMIRQLFRRPGFSIDSEIEYHDKPFPESMRVSWHSASESAELAKELDSVSVGQVTEGTEESPKRSVGGI